MIPKFNAYIYKFNGPIWFGFIIRFPRWKIEHYCDGSSNDVYTPEKVLYLTFGSFKGVSKRLYKKADEIVEEQNND